jgi:hypothetical protein
MTSYTSAHDRVSVAQFHGDLERELRIRAGAVVAGHLGSRVAGRSATGAPELAAASAPAMVALCTDHYFQDGVCGRDWAVIAERERDHRIWTGRATSFIIPVVWQRLKAPPPPAVAATPTLSQALASPFAGQQGLRELLQKKKDKEYSYVVETTAVAVLEAYSEQLRPMPTAEAERMEPAFGSPPADGGGGTAESPASSERMSTSGPKPAVDFRRSLARPRRPPAVAISYVGADQGWADWIAALLTREGHHVNKILLRQGQDEKAVELIRRARSGVDWVVAVLSKNYFASLPGEFADWERALADDGEGDEAKMIRVRVDAAPLPAPIRGMRNVDVSDPRSDRAARLLEAVLTPA